MATLFTSKYSVTGAVSWLIRLLLRILADLCLYLHRTEDSTLSEQIKGHLVVMQRSQSIWSFLSIIEYRKVTF
jgi:hypothetical protein